MIVFSGFDGMGVLRIALDKMGVPVEKYYASEIDQFATSISSKHYSDIIQMGDIRGVKGSSIGHVDLFTGGSPCQGFSFAGKELAFDDPRSKLFFEWLRLLKELREINPNMLFLLENVRMKQRHLDVITEMVGVEPILINSALVSAQTRHRYYWTNIPGIEQPKDRGIMLPDIFDYHELTKWEKQFSFNLSTESYLKIDRKGKVKKTQHKASCLTGGHRGDGNHSDMDLILHSDGSVRRYSILECERLQTIPENYTEGVSNTQRYKMLGNGWTLEVIIHILKYMTGENTPQLGDQLKMFA